MAIKIDEDNIWASNDNGSINLCTGNKRQPPYICFYPAKPDGMPPMAIYLQDGVPTLQLTKNGETKFINLFDLVKS